MEENHLTQVFVGRVLLQFKTLAVGQGAPSCDYDSQRIPSFRAAFPVQDKLKMIR